MPCQVIDPDRERRRGETKLLCRPVTGATDGLVGVLRREWHRTTARKPLLNSREAHTGRDDNEPTDQMAVR